MSLYEVLQCIVEKWTFREILITYGIGTFIFLVFGGILEQIKILNPLKLKSPVLSWIIKKIKKKKTKFEDPQ